MLLTVRRAESLLVTLVIPIGILVFFSKVDAVNTTLQGAGRLPRARRARAGGDVERDGEPRHRHRVRTSLRRAQAARLDAAVARRSAQREDAQRARARSACRPSSSCVTGIALGWDATGGLVAAVALLLVGTVAFAGIGMLLAGTLRAEANLAVANGLFLVLLFLGGMAYPLAKLPDAVEAFAKLLPAAALSETVRAVLTPGRVVPGRRARGAARVGDRRAARRRPLVPLGGVSARAGQRRSIFSDQRRAARRTSVSPWITCAARSCRRHR